MPKYRFECSFCKYSEDLNLSISKYLKLIKEKRKCVECDSGVLFQKLDSIYSKIEKRKEDVEMESKEEVRRIIEKIHSGDEKTIRDIYGDKPNPLKNGE